MDQRSLEELRSTIDAIDKRLVSLLNERAQVAVDIGKLKAELGRNTYDPVREGKVLDKINAMNAGPLPKGSLEEIYATIITACREIQLDPGQD